MDDKLTSYMQVYTLHGSHRRYLCFRGWKHVRFPDLESGSKYFSTQSFICKIGLAIRRANHIRFAVAIQCYRLPSCPEVTLPHVCTARDTRSLITLYSFRVPSKLDYTVDAAAPFLQHAKTRQLYRDVGRSLCWKLQTPFPFGKRFPLRR